MGKGNRSRIERAMADTNNGSYEVKAKKNKVSGAGIFVAISAILVVIALLMGCISMINQGGWFARSQTVVKTENYKVTGTMMNYFFMSQFNNYYSMYQSYLGSSATREQILSVMGIDASKSFKDQYMKSGAEGAEQVTVFDFYMSMTEEYVTRLLTYCEYAPQLEIELTPEDLEEIDHSIEHMKESYESTKALYDQYFGGGYYKNFSAYLAASYGAGINENDLRECMKLTTLASKVEERLSDDFKVTLRGEEGHASIEQYVKDNPASFLMADYYAYSFSVNSKGMTEAEFEAEKEEILEKAKALAGVEDKEAYKAAVLALLKEAELKVYRDKNWSTILKENDNDEEKAEKALLEKFEEKEWTEAIQELKFDATLQEKYKYPTTHTELSKWIFGYDAGEHTEDCEHEGEHEKDQDPAKVGDTTYFENTSKKEETVKKETTGTTAEETTTEAAAPAAETTAESTTTTGTGTTSTEKITVTTYTVTVYLLEKETYRDETQTEKFGYALFTTKEDAEKFYEAMVAKNTKDLDTLIDVLNDLHEEITVNTYDAKENYVVDTLKDQQKIDTMDEWLKNAAEGSLSPVTEVVKTTTSKDKDGKSQETKTTYYAVMVYEGKGDKAWFYTALNGATSVEIEDWYEENGLELTYNDKAYRYINI